LVALASVSRSLGDEITLARLAGSMDVEFRDDRIFMSKQDGTDRLRTEDCSNRASEVAKLSLVRQQLMKRQRAFRQPPGLSTNGRDMGTILFPTPTLNILFTPPPDPTPTRRYH